MERRDWLDKQEELLTRYVQFPVNTPIESETDYGSVLVAEERAQEQAKRNVPIPPDSHYSKVERVSSSEGTNGRSSPGPSPSTSPASTSIDEDDEGNHYGRIGTKAPAKPLKPSDPQPPPKST